MGTNAKMNEFQALMGVLNLKYIDDYDDLDEQTVVGGDDLLAGLNKDSSNGYGQLKGKVKYVDFENKCISGWPTN